MNLYQKAINRTAEEYRQHEAMLKRHASESRGQEYALTEKQARYNLEEAKKELDTAIVMHNYARAHSALWSVMSCQAALDAILYPNV